MIRTNKIPSWDELSKEFKEKITEFVADDSELEELHKENIAIYTLWKKKDRFCVIRAFEIGVKVEVSVDYPYTEPEEIVKRLFKYNSNIFCKMIRGGK